MRWFVLGLLVLAPQDETTLRVAWGTIRTVDPALAVSSQDVRVAEALFEGLAAAEAKVEGAVVTFKLPDRKWTDGRPVKASDYRFAWLRCLDPSTGSPWAFRFRHIKNARAWHEAQQLSARILLYENGSLAERADTVETTSRIGTRRHAAAFDVSAAGEKDEKLQAKMREAIREAAQREDLTEDSVGVAAAEARTLRVTLEAARAGFPELAATAPFRPVPEHVVTARRDQWTHPDHLVTCGAFVVEKWTRQGLVLGEGTGPGVKRVSFVTADLTGEVWPIYERGLIDWIDRSLVPAEKVDALVAAGEIRGAPGAAVSFLRLNAAAKPGLRRAMALAIDRAPLVKKAGPGSAETRSLAGGGEGPARDLAAAMTALTTDYPDLKTPRLRLLVWRDPAAEDLARAVRDQFEAALAISMRIDPREGPPYQAALASGDYDLALFSFAPEAGDPAGILDLFPDGRTAGEKSLLDSALAIPLLREGEWFAAKPRVQAKPGTPLGKVGLKN
jgi:ABC-type oligopeptide transport system substrate-binding subunit